MLFTVYCACAFAGQMVFMLKLIDCHFSASLALVHVML